MTRFGFRVRESGDGLLESGRAAIAMMLNDHVAAADSALRQICRIVVVDHVAVIFALTTHPDTGRPIERIAGVGLAIPGASLATVDLCWWFRRQLAQQKRRKETAAS